MNGLKIVGEFYMSEHNPRVPLTVAAEELGISARQLRALCEQGYIGRKEKGSRYWDIYRDELDKFKVTPRPGPGSPKRKKSA